MENLQFYFCAVGCVVVIFSHVEKIILLSSLRIPMPTQKFNADLFEMDFNCASGEYVKPKYHLLSSIFKMLLIDLI